MTIDDDAPDLEKYDELEEKKKRLHCWVMIRKGDRQVTETFFVEPTTGRRYDVVDAPYQKVEAVFNHKNFWINLNEESKVNELNLEFEEDLGWEYVMLTDQDKKEAEEEEDEDDEVSEEDEEDKDFLDMPPPWSRKLYINREAFLNLCPNGEKTTFYKKCRVDEYAPCTQVDGLVKRVVLFHDYKCLITNETRYYYKNRKDKLHMRIRYPYEFKLVEYYEPSDKTNYWKKLVQIDGQERTIFFYHHRNNEKNRDGLIYRREIIGSKTIEKYKDRKDKLVYRSVEFVPEPQDDDEKTKERNAVSLKLPDNHIGSALITRMVQEFELDPDKPAGEQIRKTEFNIEKGIVNIYYHYVRGKIRAGEESFLRSDLLGKASYCL